MTKKEYNELLKKLVSEPDSLILNAEILRGAIMEDCEQYEQTSVAFENAQTRITELRKANTEYFMQIGQPIEPEVQEEKALSPEEIAMGIMEGKEV